MTISKLPINTELCPYFSGANFLVSLFNPIYSKSYTTKILLCAVVFGFFNLIIN